MPSGTGSAFRGRCRLDVLRGLGHELRLAAGRAEVIRLALVLRPGAWSCAGRPSSRRPDPSPSRHPPRAHVMVSRMGAMVMMVRVALVALGGWVVGHGGSPLRLDELREAWGFPRWEGQAPPIALVHLTVSSLDRNQYPRPRNGCRHCSSLISTTLMRSPPAFPLSPAVPGPADEVLVLDCETTGLNPRIDEVIAVAAIVIRGSRIMTSEAYKRSSGRTGFRAPNPSRSTGSGRVMWPRAGLCTKFSRVAPVHRGTSHCRLLRGFRCPHARQVCFPVHRGEAPQSPHRSLGDLFRPQVRRRPAWDGA